jgi:hypothetical protein
VGFDNSKCLQTSNSLSVDIFSSVVSGKRAKHQEIAQKLNDKIYFFKKEEKYGNIAWRAFDKIFKHKIEDDKTSRIVYTKYAICLLCVKLFQCEIVGNAIRHLKKTHLPTIKSIKDQPAKEILMKVFNVDKNGNELDPKMKTKTNNKDEPIANRKKIHAAAIPSHKIKEIKFDITEMLISMGCSDLATRDTEFHKVLTV